MKWNEFNALANRAKAQGCKTFGDLAKFIGKNQLPVYINGVPQSREDMTAFERSLRLGEVIAFGKCYNGIIYYTTKDYAGG